MSISVMFIPLIHTLLLFPHKKSDKQFNNEKKGSKKTMNTTTNPDVLGTEAQQQAAAATVADYTKVTGAAGTFDDISGKVQGERRVKLMAKVELVYKGLDQSLRDNQIGIKNRLAEIAEKEEKIAYLNKKLEELKQGFDSGEIASITDLNNYMGKAENKRLCTTVGYSV